jgi:hypothetical protein
MLVSSIKFNEKSQPVIRQQVTIICDECFKEHVFSKYYSYIQGIEKYKKDLCLSCRRKLQYFNAGEGSKNRMKEKTYEEIYGIEKADELKKQKSDQYSGKGNPNYNNGWHGIHPSQFQKGKTKEEIYGIEKAKNIKESISRSVSGENNPMYGKPIPIGSGNGWSGWYKGWYFRSLRELSFMINVIERFKLNWRSAEISILKIPYIGFKGEKHTYVADFLINGKYLIEVKPKKLHGSKLVQLKKEAAINFCKNNNMIYKLMDPIKLLSYLDIKRLIADKNLQFIERYKEKIDNFITD